MAQTQPQLGPHSRPLARRSVDGRSTEGRFLAAARAQLTAHIGGTPSAVEAALIERCAWLMLHVALFDRRAVQATACGLNAHDAKQYLAYSNSLGRALAQLGLRGAGAKPPTLAEHLARRAAERGAGDAAGAAA